MLKLPGADEQVQLIEKWLQGRYEIPEIADKWAKGPVVGLELELPKQVSAGETIAVRAVVTANKVGHDFPTGPLDIIQSWVELRVTDAGGRVVFTSGTRDERHFLAPGTVLFKAEPVDQHGNLIDRHNLWEMVGVRFRRSLFPGYSDAFDYRLPYSVHSSRDLAGRPTGTAEHRAVEMPPLSPGRYRVDAVLNYRKVDQFLLNYLLGEREGLTAPVVALARSAAWLEVGAGAAGGQPAARLDRIEDGAR
jgi:hypothetical protein